MTLRNALAAVALLFLFVACEQNGEKPREVFTIDTLNSFTPVKDQGRSEVCWVYAMLAAIETEHIGRGDSVNLSPYYIVRQLLEHDAQRSYFSPKPKRISMRGMGCDLIDAIETYGLAPYDSYRTGENTNIKVLANKISRIAAMRSGLAQCNERTRAALDAQLGIAPRRIYLYSAQYTPQEFSRSVCAPGEYESLTSFTHHPFYERFALEVPDNRHGSFFLNLPIDSLLSRVVNAVAHSHGVCWEGDISEPQFSFAEGTATLPSGKSVSQEARQHDFESLRTTDDHCMAIVGLAHNADGQRFFIMKNSWGTANPYGGLMYVSFDYFRMNTIAVFLPKN